MRRSKNNIGLCPNIAALIISYLRNATLTEWIVAKRIKANVTLAIVTLNLIENLKFHECHSYQY